MARPIKRTTRQKIYSLLKSGFSQCQIGRKLKLSRKVVNYHVSEFLKKNLIECIDERTYIKTYRLTPLGKSITPDMLLREKPKTSRQGAKTYKNIHRICRVMKVLSKPEIKPGLKWKKVLLKNGVEQYYLYWPNKREEHITFRYQPSKQKKEFGSLVFWVPEKKLTSKEWLFWCEYIKEEVGHVYALAMKLFQCNLGLPEEYQPMEFAVPARNEAQRKACKLGLKFGDAYTDWSRHGLPDRIRGEFESRDPDVAEALDILVNADHRIPQRVESLEDLHSRNTKMLHEMQKIQLRTMDTQKFLMESMEKMQEFISIGKEKDEKLEKESQNKMYG